MRDYLHFLQTNFPWLLRFTAFYMGACVGSFLNVCILRIPANKSIVTPRSHCVCGKPIAWYDNLPILSWFILRGRARCCGQKFSFRYPLIEAVTAFTFLWLWVTLPPASAVAGMVFFSILLMGGMIDLDTMLLPDITTVGGMFVGLILSSVFPQIQHVPPTPELWLGASLHGGVISMIGVIVGTGVVFWIRELGELFFKKEAMGYGDVLLMGCLGAFCGWQGAVFSLFGGACIGCCVILPWMAFAWAFRKPAEETSPPTMPEPAVAAPVTAEGAPPDPAAPIGHDTPAFGVAIPFGPWLALGGFLYYAVPILHSGVDRYFDLLRALAFGEMVQ